MNYKLTNLEEKNKIFFLLSKNMKTILFTLNKKLESKSNKKENKTKQKLFIRIYSILQNVIVKKKIKSYFRCKQILYRKEERKIIKKKN